MAWRDFFYFSKGERSGLIVLLCLITIAGILLILNNKPEPAGNSKSQQTSAANTREKSNDQSEAQSLKEAQDPKAHSAVHESSGLSPTPVATTKSENKKDLSGSDEHYSAGLKEKPIEKKESVSERVNRLTSYSHPSYTRTEKFAKGTVVELNTADTTILKKVPGIGSAFAKRIISYRNLLGGFYSVTQLSEVYGIDEERYNALVAWFSADPSHISVIDVNNISQDSLNKHPYINYRQAKAIMQLRKQKGKLSGWENLQLLNEFTDVDKIRLQHYLSFK